MTIGPAVSTTAPIEVLLSQGVSVRVSAGCDEAMLSMVLSVLESSACGLFVMSKGFKEAKIYVNSEFDLRRVLHEAASIFRIYDRGQPRPYTLG